MSREKIHIATDKAIGKNKITVEYIEKYWIKNPNRKVLIFDIPENELNKQNGKI